MKKPKKTSKSTSNSKDLITGQTFRVDGLGELTLDKVYDKNSSLVKNALGITSDYLSKLQSFNAEFEANSKYIVFTTKQIDTSGQSAVTRTVLEGSFQFSNGTAKSARIDKMGQISDSGDYGYGDILDLGVSIAKASSPSAWASSIEKGVSDFWARNETNPNSIEIGQSSPGVITGNIAAFRAFGEGRFFYEGWEANPFASNLI